MEVNVDIPTENIGNHRSETFREHDVFMVNLMRMGFMMIPLFVWKYMLIGIQSMMKVHIGD